ncbi:MAG: META domain-containing protein [Anaerolineae bacterium]|nr:META domain-containing protein [Anaerolineae bacterium]MCB9106328.1 META domain-containing protein [Anaerolineales bacterium]
MKKTDYWYLILMGAFILILSGCSQSTPESPQEAAAEVKSQLALAGTAWELESIGGPDDLVPVLPDTRLSLNYFVERYAGYGGCNWFLGVYGTDGSSLRMQTPAATTIYCESEGVVQQEATYMTALVNVTEFKMEDGKLAAYTVEDQRLLTFKPAETVPFEGTTWELKLGWSGERWTPVVPLSTVTAQFEGDQMSGSGGCNNYSASIEKEGEQLTIGTVTGTEMACTDPDGVMEQETAYFSQLSSVAGYTVAGGSLALLDANGEAILLFGAAE